MTGGVASQPTGSCQSQYQASIIDALAGGLYVSLGFSGTGLMHAPAAGDLVAELVLDGQLKSVAGHGLSMNRFGKATPARESTGF